MRLIDADALGKRVKEFRDDAPQSSIRRYVCNVILSMLGDENQTPTIEAEPVRHGRWVDNHCSECREMPMGTEAWERLGIEPPRFEWFMDFCPCCGAKMRGDTDGQA